MSCEEANASDCTGGSSCDSGFTSIGNKCMKVMPGRANYLAALTSCISIGAKLASIESQDEQDAVFALTGSTGAWLGLTDFLDEGVFSWVDGVAVGYTNWKKNQPNNGQKNQHCVWIRQDGNWDDVTCKRTLAYVCQK